MAITFTTDRKFVVREIVLDEKTINFLLSLNVRNRRRAIVREAVYGDSLAENRWCADNPVAMSFTVNESMTWLLDGQTRLYAMLRAARFDLHALLHIVPDNSAEDVFRTIDIGRARSCGATLGALGEKNATNRAAAVNTLAFYISKGCGVDPGLVNGLVPEIRPLFDALPFREHKYTGKKPTASVYAGILNAIRLGLTSIEESAKLLDGALADRGEDTSATRILSRLMSRINSRGAKNIPQERRNDKHGDYSRTDIISMVTHYAKCHAEGTPINIIRHEAKYDDLYRTPTPSMTHLAEIAESWANNQPTERN